MEYVNPVWYESENMVEVAKYLQSSSAKILSGQAAAKIVQWKGHGISIVRAEDLFLSEWIKTAKAFISNMYSNLEKDIAKHSYNFPLFFWPNKSYMSFRGRVLHQNTLKFLRVIPVVRNYVVPRKIVDPIPRIILPGVDYSAESLIFTNSLMSKGCTFDKSKLEWMHLDARADYAHNVVCFGSEDFETLLSAWFFGQVDSWHEYIEALYTMIEEAMHHMVDQIVWVSRYGKDDSKEHYWMHAYGDFPEKVYNTIEDHSEKYIGIIKKKLI